MISPGQKSRRQQGLLLVLGLAVLLLAALDTGRFWVRLDLSANHQYTISGVSRRIARELPEQVSITYYVSEKLRSRYPFPAQVQDLLDEYAAYSRGKISVSTVDPATARPPVSPESLGIMAQQMQVVERQDINVATVYSGIVIRYLDRSEALPFVSDLSTIEYDITSKIRALQNKTEKVVGILLGDGRRNLQSDYRGLLQELAQRWRILPLQPGQDIPAEVSVLFVIGSRDLDAYDLFPVDQYVMRGGKALFAVSPIDVDLTQGLRAARDGSPAVEDMLAGYGARVRDELLLDSLNQRISFRVSQSRIMVVQYPHWVTISERSVARDNPVTSRFSGLDLYWPSPVEPVTVPGVDARVLVSSSPDAWIMRDPLETNPALAQSPAVQDIGPRGRHPLAVTLSGTFPGAFAGKPVPVRAGEKPRWPAAATRSAETRLIVVGDAAFASDMAQYTNAGYNMTFLSNCADWLGRDDELLSIKTRSQVDLRLNRVTDPAARSWIMGFSQAVSVVIVPLLVVAFGVLRLLGRRRRQERSAPREGA
jgi:gliding-associated putative ABC transporter substrate-binding component GldG